jgi:hypothetical protein
MKYLYKITDNETDNRFVHELLLHVYGKGKSKAIPLQAWTGPEGSRRLRLPDFKTVGT